MTADNICREWGLTREELDEFALKSQQKAEAAQKSGAFDNEIVPVMIKKKKETIEFKVDEGPRAKASFASIMSKSSIFMPVFANTFLVDATGPIPITSGRTPARAPATKVAIGLTPNSFAFSSQNEQRHPGGYHD